MSIFSKIRSIGLSNIHTLLDSIASLNTVGQFEQYLRDLKEARDGLDDQSAAGRGRKKFLEQQIATAKAHAAAADEQIDILLGDDDPSNDHLATPLQIKLDALNAQIAGWESELESVSAEVAQYDQAVQRLDIRVTEATGKLSALRSMEQGAKAKEKAAHALDGLDFGSAPDTSGAEAKLAERAAVADNALNRSLNRVTDTIGGPSAAEASAAAALAARRAAIAAKKAAGQ